MGGRGVFADASPKGLPYGDLYRLQAEGGDHCAGLIH